MADDSTLLVVTQSLDTVRQANFTARCSLVTTLLFGLILGWKLFFANEVYIQPPGGPGLVKPGVLDDQSALDYARRQLEARWTFTPETYKERMDEVVASTHASYTKALRAEIERDTQIVRQYEVGSQLIVLTKRVLSRKGNNVLVGLHARRTQTWGSEERDAEYYDAKLVVTLLGNNGHRRDIVAAGADGVPGIEFAKKGK